MDHIDGLRPHREELESAVVRFAGDSGDGMQLTGGQFTLSTALAGNDLETFPDFPAEIRAPSGTTFGVSAFQINFGSSEIRHRRRPRRRAGGDQSRGAQGQPARAQASRHGHRSIRASFDERNLAQGRPTTPIRVDDGTLDS